MFVSGGVARVLGLARGLNLTFFVNDQVFLVNLVDGCEDFHVVGFFDGLLCRLWEEVLDFAKDRDEAVSFGMEDCLFWHSWSLDCDVPVVS